MPVPDASGRAVHLIDAGDAAAVALLALEPGEIVDVAGNGVREPCPRSARKPRWIEFDAGSVLGETSPEQAEEALMKLLLDTAGAGPQ